MHTHDRTNFDDEDNFHTSALLSKRQEVYQESTIMAVSVSWWVSSLDCQQYLDIRKSIKSLQ